MKNKFKHIVILGNSLKFIDIISSLYPKSNIKIYSWRSIMSLNFKKKKFNRKPDLIFICGYNYKSQWFSYKIYYNANISMPFNFIKFISKKKTIVVYIDTINKIKKKYKVNKKCTFSRYEFAKKELGYKLYKNFFNLRILNLPIIKNEKNKAIIYGNKFTQFIFNILIYFNLIHSIKISNLKKLIFSKIQIKKNYKPIRLTPLFLKIPRSLFFDRFLRFIYE